MTRFSAYDSKADILPWRENEDLPRIEHRREPPGGDMQRRGGSGQPIKQHGRVGVRPKAHKTAAKSVSDDDLQEQLDRRTHERDEALEQQAATSEVLRVISQSPGDLQPVFNAVAESAARLCESFDSAVWRREDDRLRLVAHHGAISQAGSESFLPL